MRPGQLNIMDTKQAFAVLGLDRQSSLEEIEERFRTLANQHHPDHGGEHESMAELNKARSVALRTLTLGTTLVPLEALNAAMTAVVMRQEERKILDRRVDNMRKQLYFRSTSKFRRNRRIAGMFIAIAAAAIFLSEKIPTNMLYQTISWEHLQTMESRERESYDSMRAEEGRRWTNLWNVMFFGVAVVAGLAAWFFTSHIDRVNHDLEDLEEQTGTKTLLHLFLQQILGEKIRMKWTLGEIAESISTGKNVPKKYRYTARQIGSIGLAQFLIDRALQLNLVSINEELVQDNFVEYYMVTAYAADDS